MLIKIISFGLGILMYIYLEDKKKKKQIDRDCNPYLWHSDEVNERIHGIKPKERL